MFSPRPPVRAPRAGPMLTRRGGVLVRQAAPDVETTTWRQARRKRRPEPSPVATAAVRPSPAHTSWKNLADAICTVS